MELMPFTMDLSEDHGSPNRPLYGAVFYWGTFQLRLAVIEKCDAVMHGSRRWRILAVFVG